MTDTETVARPETDIANPVTGELIAVDDIDALIQMYAELSEKRQQLSLALSRVKGYLIAVAEKDAVKDLRGNGRHLEVVTKTKYEWDGDRLNLLLDEGLPAERFEEIVTYEVKVDARKMLAVGRAGNDKYRAIIDSAHAIETDKYIVVKQQKAPNTLAGAAGEVAL